MIYEFPTRCQICYAPGEKPSERPESFRVAVRPGAAEDAADAEAARRALDRRKKGEHALTSAEVDELLAAKTPLAFYRKRAGWTQAKLAERTGIAQGFLSEIEAGRKSGDVQTLRKIADLLKISLDDLVVPGASDSDVAKFAREVGFVGVGIYPTSGFVHVDARARSYFWVDSSAPGRRNRERGIMGDLSYACGDHVLLPA